jgi:predicted porin
MGGFMLNFTHGFGGTPGSDSTGEQSGIGGRFGDDKPFGIGFAYSESKRGVVTATSNSSIDDSSTASAGCNTVGVGNPGDICIKTWVVGAGYTFNDLYVFGSVSEVKTPLAQPGPAAPPFGTVFAPKTGGAGATGLFTAGGLNNSKSDIVDVGFEYRFNKSWATQFAYIHANYEFLGASQKGKLDEVMLGLNYYLDKQTTLYAEFARVNASHMYNPGTFVSLSTDVPGIDNSQNVFGAGIRYIF